MWKRLIVKTWNLIENSTVKKLCHKFRFTVSNTGKKSILLNGVAKHKVCWLGNVENNLFIIFWQTLQLRWTCKHCNSKLFSECPTFHVHKMCVKNSVFTAIRHLKPGVDYILYLSV